MSSHTLSPRGILRICLCIGATAVASPAQAQTAARSQPDAGAPAPRGKSAVDRMNERGPEAEQLARRAGTWNVVVKFRPSPSAPPSTSTGLVAERTMVGQYLEEVLKPGPGSKTPDFRRISYLYYSRVEGRWQYVSVDTRFPVGVMPAFSFDRGTDRTVTLQFEPLGFVGWGPEVEGRMMRSNYVITRESDDHEFARQSWAMADGTGQEWVAVEYEYTRKR
jgi:hypothetical protein